MKHLFQANLMLLGLIAVCLPGLQPGSLAADRPNIVLILADDVSADMFSCYGQPGAAKTPNIYSMT